MKIKVRVKLNGKELHSSVHSAQQQPIAASKWIGVHERMPENNQRVVVRTDEGTTFFLSPINGAFPKNIKEWYELPK